jgi:thiamine biosynthesis protein ThiS
MTLIINGEEKTFAGDLTLSELLTQLGMKADRVAVELNRQIVSRADWPRTRLRQGDRLEIVHFVGGGCAPRGTRSAPSN